MAENLMNSEHKASNDKHRKHYSDIFKFPFTQCRTCKVHSANGGDDDCDNKGCGLVMVG
jgi:hypothetical protein